MKVLNDPGQWRATFRRDGFIKVKNVISDEIIKKCIFDINKLASNRLNYLGLAGEAGNNLGDRLAYLKKNNEESYLGVARQSQYLASLHQIALSDPILGLLSSLGIERPVIATRPVLHLVDDRLRIEGGYYKTPPHQDWRSFQGSLDSVVFWVPMTDVSVSDHPLEVVRGSHRNGLLASEECPFGHCVASDLLGGMEFEALEVNCGDVIAMSGFLVHRTGERGGDQLRIAASFRYNNADEGSFVERNYPNPYTYRPDLRILHPAVATEDKVAKFFDER